MGGIDGQDGVELEADGTGLDVADRGEEEGGEGFVVRQPLLDAGGHLLDQLLARRFLDDFHERLEFRRPSGWSRGRGAAG